MYRAGTGSAKRGKGGSQSSESDSDWDTTVEFPTPRHSVIDPALDNRAENLKTQPSSRLHASLEQGTGNGKSDLAIQNSEHSEPASPSFRNESKTPASASAVHFSPFYSGSESRNHSPASLYTARLQDTVSAESDRNGSSTPPVKDRKGNKYQPSPSPNLKTPATVDEASIPNWDDSDAEQEILRELHTTLKKEKSRESQSEAARKQVQVLDEGDHSSATGHSMSAPDKRSRAQEDKQLQQNSQEVEQRARVNQSQRAEVSSLPAHWSGRSDFNENAQQVEAYPPYQSLVVKDPDGKRFLYYFNEGSTAFFEVVEKDSEAVMPKVADKAEQYIQRGWQEIFGLLRIVTMIVIFLVIEVFNYVTSHVVRPLILGVIEVTGNKLVKPVLATLFSVILQPFAVFLWNLMSSLRLVFQPLTETIGGIMTKCAILLRSFRLVEVNLGGQFVQSRRSLRQGVQCESEVV